MKNHTVLSEIIHFSLLSRPIPSTYQSFVPLPLLLPTAKGTSHNSFTISLSPRIPNFLFCSSCVPDHSNHYSVLIPSSSYSVIIFLCPTLPLSLLAQLKETHYSLSTRPPPPNFRPVQKYDLSCPIVCIKLKQQSCFLSPRSRPT